MCNHRTKQTTIITTITGEKKLLKWLKATETKLPHDAYNNNKYQWYHKRNIPSKFIGSIENAENQTI